MKASMQLSQEKEMIFEKRLSRIKGESLKCFAGVKDYEDIFQIMLISYVNALKKADLTLNYHAYCMRHAVWMAKQYIRKRSEFSNKHQFIGDIQTQLAYHPSGMISDESSMNEAIIGIHKIHEKMSEKHKAVINYKVLGDLNSKPKVKLRQQQLIQKSFKDNIREFLCAA